MSENSIQVTISLEAPQLDDEQLQEATENLRDEIKEVEGVEQADLMPVETAPPDSKGIGGFLLGILTAEINAKNLKTLVRFLGDRLFGKTIKIKTEGNGKKLELEIRRPEDLEAIMPKIDNFIKG
ncbi:MAG: hypothetical protein F6J89_26630 [Symploca sp. SIO1C4]|uniref:Uncharacterized protein n=1 Tax=Symploca sp. SIO1C4 TaxID=2607765 RepID=A0A6B3NPD0_9CYAN|nr:hypothetical protein [Symploca sp. SIO1C4]